MSRVLIIILSLCFLYGCGGSYTTIITPSGEKVAPKKGKRIVDAYLFDAKIKRGKKQNSFRLELYETDSVIAIGGRGYFGKGALKGLLTKDSMFVYFPTMDEYLYESVSDLFESFDCSGDFPKLNLLELFSNLPDKVIDDINASVIKINNSDKQPKYQIRFINCPWQLDLTYDKKDNKWRIRKFNFSDGDKTVLKGNRREYQSNRKVKQKRFEVPLKNSSVRIIL